MGFRITTNMMMNTYRYNLQGSTKRLSDARDMVLTQRRFSSYAEDPAAATLAFRLRRDYLHTSSYLANTKDVYSKFNTAWHNLAGAVEDLSDRTARASSIRGVNDGTGEARRALAIDLRETAESLVYAMNQKLGDHFIFGGNDALNPPFSWSSDMKTLYYRGVNVNAGSVKMPTADEPAWVKDLENGDPYEKAVYKYLTRQYDEDELNEAVFRDFIEDQYGQYVEYVKSERAAGNIPEDDGSIPDGYEYAQWVNYQLGKTDEKPEGIEEFEENFLKYLKDEVVDVEADADKQAYLQDCLDYISGDRDNGIPDVVDNLYKAVDENLANETGLSDDEIQGWTAYYKRETDEKPTAEPPGWVTKSENGDYAVDEKYVLDRYGTPDEEKIKAEVEKSREWTPADDAWLAYFKDQAEYKKLQSMSGEEMYIDLGMGAAESSPNNPVKGTYFNNALCGIDFLGFGVDEDGDPLNLALIMRELADVFDTWDEDTEGYNPALAKDTAKGLSSDELAAKAMRLVDKLKAAQENTTEHWVELDANSVYLQTSQTRLEIQQTDLNMQILDIEQVDLAEAITAFSWEQYCYNAALKIGNQLLSQSLIDYMR